MSFKAQLPWLVGALLTACSGASPPADSASPPPGEGTCDAGRVQGYVGERYRQALDARLLQDSGAATLRVLRPGMAGTLDYRADRLDVRLDADEIIVTVRCG